MPDITMCRGEDEAFVCPLRKECYRHIANPNTLRQSYFTSVPGRWKQGLTPVLKRPSAQWVCEYY